MVSQTSTLEDYPILPSKGVNFLTSFIAASVPSADGSEDKSLFSPIPWLSAESPSKINSPSSISCLDENSYPCHLEELDSPHTVIDELHGIGLEIMEGNTTTSTTSFLDSPPHEEEGNTIPTGTEEQRSQDEQDSTYTKVILKDETGE